MSRGAGNKQFEKYAEACRDPELKKEWEEIEKNFAAERTRINNKKGRKAITAEQAKEKIKALTDGRAEVRERLKNEAAASIYESNGRTLEEEAKRSKKDNAKLEKIKELVAKVIESGSVRSEELQKAVDLQSAGNSGMFGKEAAKNSKEEKALLKEAEKKAAEEANAAKKEKDEEAKATKKEETARAAAVERAKDPEAFDKKQAEKDAKAAKKQAEKDAEAAKRQAEKDAEAAEKQAEKEAAAAKKAEEKEQARLASMKRKAEEAVEEASEKLKLALNKRMRLRMPGQPPSKEDSDSGEALPCILPDSSEIDLSKLWALSGFDAPKIEQQRKKKPDLPVVRIEDLPSDDDAPKSKQQRKKKPDLPVVRLEDLPSDDEEDDE